MPKFLIACTDDIPALSHHTLFFESFSLTPVSISGNQILVTSPRQPEVWKPSGQFQVLSGPFQGMQPQS